MFFFAGFNENAAKYSYLFKIFLEQLNFILPLKIVIPFLPVYKPEDYPRGWMTNPDKFSQIYSWYNYEIKQLPDQTYSVKIIPNVEKDEQIISCIKKEIEKLGDTEKIILSGFSMGGRYLLEILNKLKIKTKFNIMFKTSLLLYENPLKNEKDADMNKNRFYVYFSANDKIANYTNSMRGINILYREFQNVKVKFDNGVTSHSVDYKCLAFLEQIFRKEIIGVVGNS